MKNGLVIVVLIGWILFPINTPAGDQAPSALHGEPATTKNPEASKLAKGEPTESAPSVESQIRDGDLSKENSATSPSDAMKKNGPPPAGKNQKSTSAAPVPVVRDRRWIIREAPTESKAIKKAPINPVKWKNEAQMKHCESDLKHLGSAFFDARYNSIQGDSCACAENAGRFLVVYEKIDRECPHNFLAYEGYSERIVRNMRWLKALGEKRCMGPRKSDEESSASVTGQHGTAASPSNEGADNPPQTDEASLNRKDNPSTNKAPTTSN